MQAKMKCAIYTRVSTDNQAEIEFNSCEAQEEKISSFIHSQEDMEIFKVYSDPGYTGASINRPALKNLLDDIKQNEINLVVSYKIDRLSRSPKDFYQLIELFEKHGVDFISVTERFDTSTPSGRLLRNIMLTFAQFERELASERTKDKMIQRAHKGMWNGGTTPLGYKSIDKKLVIVQKDAEIIRNIYEYYLSTRSLAKVFFDARDKGLSFTKSTISHILRNPIYTGKIRYDSKFSQGMHEAIISEQMFNTAQDIHKKKQRTMRNYKNWLFAGLVHCKECNTFMTPHHVNKKKDGHRSRYYYYRCTTTLTREWSSCNTKQVSAGKLENYILENLERISFDRHYIDSRAYLSNFESPSRDRQGLEKTGVCSHFSGDLLEKTLLLFIEGIRKRR
jgi:site-specific DNA recombinase